MELDLILEAAMLSAAKPLSLEEFESLFEERDLPGRDEQCLYWSLPVQQEPRQHPRL